MGKKKKMSIKIKKTKKSKKQRGNNTYGHGARKKAKGKGSKGGKGMAGTGKRADHKKSLILNVYGKDYFGKKSKTKKFRKQKKKIKVLNLRDIEKNKNSFLKKYGKNKELVLKGYKILGEGEITDKLTIKADAFAKTAIEKIEKVGGKAISLKKVVSKDRAKQGNPKEGEVEEKGSKK